MIFIPALIALWEFSIAFLTNEEVDVILSSLKHLKVGKCIFSVETDLNITYIKKLNLNYIMTGYMTPEMLEDYLTEMNLPDASIAVVMKNKLYVENLFSKKYESLNWFIWFLITDDNLRDVEIPTNCQFFQIKTNGDKNYQLIESYKLRNIFIGENYGIWTPEKGLNASLLNWYERRKNFRGIELKVEILVNFNLDGFSLELCKKYKVSMSMLEFYEDTARALNFTILKESKYLNEDIVSGRYSGKIQEVSTCIWAITGLEKEKDWVFLHSGIKIGVATKFRGTNEIGWGAYVTPFAKDMWVAVLLWLFVSTAALIIVRGCCQFTMYMNILTAFFCLCNHDPMVTHPPDEPCSASTKLVYLMVLTVPSVIIPAYSGYILSTLSCVLPLIPFVDLKTFIADGSFTLTAPDNSFGLRFLRESQDPELKFIYENSFKRTSRSYEEQFEKLCKDGQLAGLFPNSKIMYKLFQCKMYIMPTRVASISTGFLLPTGSPFRKFFNKRFREHSEKGLKYQEFRTALFVTNSFEEETESLTSLNMSQMRAIFLLVVFGGLLSLIILIIEIAIEKRSQKNRKMKGKIDYELGKT